MTETFALHQLRTGKYSLEGSRREFITSYFDQHDTYSTAIVTGAEVDSEHLVFRLTPGLSRIQKTAEGQTDDRRTYEFADLPAGNCFVSVSAKPWYAQRQSSVGGEDGRTQSAVAHSLDVAYPTTFYADVTDSDEATPIPLRGGEHLPADIHLSPVPALCIVVRTSPNGRPGFSVPAILRKVLDSTEDMTPTLLNLESGSSGEFPTRNSAVLSDGAIELNGVPAGKYTVMMPDNAAGPRAGTVAELDPSRNGQELDPSAGEPMSTAKLAVQILEEDRLPQQRMVALAKWRTQSGCRTPGG